MTISMSPFGAIVRRAREDDGKRKSLLHWSISIVGPFLIQASRN